MTSGSTSFMSLDGIGSKINVVGLDDGLDNKLIQFFLSYSRE